MVPYTTEYLNTLVYHAMDPMLDAKTATQVRGALAKRLRFDPSGDALYVVDFGVMLMDKTGADWDPSFVVVPMYRATGEPFGVIGVGFASESAVDDLDHRAVRYGVDPGWHRGCERRRNDRAASWTRCRQHRVGPAPDAF